MPSRGAVLCLGVVSLAGLAACDRGPSKEEIKAAVAEVLAEEKQDKQAAAQPKQAVPFTSERMRQSVQEPPAGRVELAASPTQAPVNPAAAKIMQLEESVTEVHGLVDSLKIRKEQYGETVKVFIDGQPAENGLVLKSPSGHAVRYVGADGEYYNFMYDDGLIRLSLKRTLNGRAVRN